METAKRQLESASVTLVDGLHVAGEIIGNVRIDLDAGESVGGVGAGQEPHRCSRLSMAGCFTMDVLSILRKKRKPGEWPRCRSPGEPGRATSADLHAIRSMLLDERYQHRSSSGSVGHRAFHHPLLPGDQVARESGTSHHTPYNRVGQDHSITYTH
jgi:hypothetical protein